MDHFYQNIQGWFTYPILYNTVIDKYPTGSHFVEVGSWLGQSSAFMAVGIANSKKNIKFDCVDTWEGSAEHNINPEFRDTLYMHFLQNTLPVKQYITPLRMPSLFAAKIYKDESLDFVFIDAAHDYNNVLADITAWFPKIKPGGIIAGHDYGNKDFPEVAQAVNTFFKNKNVLINTQEICWIHEKPIISA